MLNDKQKLEQIEKIIVWALKDSAFLYQKCHEQLVHGYSDKETLKNIEEIFDQPRFSESWKQEMKEILEGRQLKDED